MLGFSSLLHAQAPWCLANNPGSMYMSSGGYYYAAIEQTRISIGNTVIYNKPADGYKATAGSCGAGWSLINPPSRAIDLAAGNTYTIQFSTSTTYGGGYTANFGLYIDLNNDKDFIDAGEMFSTASWSATGTQALTAGALSTYTFSIPCNITPGATRMRLRSDMNWYGAFTLAKGCQTGTCNSYTNYYGETDDYSINLVLPNSVSASFIAPTEAWVKTAVTFINNNQLGYTEHAWDVNNDGSWEQRGITPNYRTISGNSGTWTTPGTKCIKLRSTNCLGRDSTVKCLTLKDPQSVPVIDFVAERTTVEQYESVRIFDLSENGPYEWNWDVYDSTTYATQGYYPNLDDGDLFDNPWGNGADRFSQNPEFAFDIPGVYTVVLQARNDRGLSQKTRKVMYITVTLPTQYNLGFGVYGPNSDNVVGSPSGTIFDNGGPFLNYSNSQGLGTRSFLQITPCNAQRIDLTMTQLKFRDAGDKLRVWDGRSPGGPNTTLLANWSSNSRPPQSVTAFSGSMYILFETDAVGVDSGFAGYYTSQLGAATVSKPDFEPTTTPSYTGVPVKFTNTTSNIVGVPTWEWEVDGQIEGLQKDFNWTFFTDGSYEVCAIIKSCVGNDKTCKTIDVVTPQDQTQLDIMASTRRPTANVDVVTLTPMSDKANRFEWTIFPATYTLTNPPTSGNGSSGVGFVNYTNTPNNMIPTPMIKFTAAGCYTLTLKAWNSNNPTATTKTVVKNKFICALDYCTPASLILSADVGINNVKVLDGTTELINNFSTSGDQAYTDYTNEHTANLTFGKTYTLEMSRVSNVDPANRKGWIDWNIDGDFNDPGEEIFFQSSSYDKVYTTTFTVPALSQSFEGVTRLRLATNYHTQSTTACGPLTAGEVEDYALVLANDNMLPVITLIGQDTIRREVGGTYTDAGATAFDVSEGNITSRIVTTNDLDMSVTGIYTYEYNVTDLSGNRAIPVTRVIIVVNDMTNPVLTLNPGAPGCIEADRNNAPYVDPGATATDNKAPFNLTSSIIVSGSVDTRTIGNYTLTYYVQDVAGNNVTQTRDVCVEDTKAPVIMPLGEDQIQINTLWVDQTMVEDAYDNNPELTRTWGFNGQVSTLVRATYPVTYTAVDQSGNQAIPVVRNYRVDDFVPPTINLNTFDVVYHEVRTPYNSVPATASDNYYPNSQVSLVRKSNNVNSNVLGTYTEEFEAIDGSGNVTNKTRTVIVRDTEAPRIFGQIIKGCVGENIWPMWGISTTDNYYSPQDLLPLIEIVNQNVNPLEEGIYSITYRVTDPSGNTSSEFTRLVQYTYWPQCMNSTVNLENINIEESINVYPNPSTGIVNIDLKGAMTQNATLEVFNAMGQKVLSQIYTDA
ncbi:MAG: DUF5011 domain-containing protein, partial [Bacteroidota bacterium]|nr:DUF5011 domain-containing protein [Bacteroidota bacterium]